MKRLWLGEGPDKLDSTKDILLGPWCVLGKEHKYPDLNKIEFAPDPIVSLEEMRYAESLTRGFAESYLSVLRKRLNEKIGIKHSKIFWRIMIMPWLLTVVQITWLKQKLINNFIKVHKQEKIFVELLDNSIKWDFECPFDFIKNGVQKVVFNHWLFSRLIENNVPENWEIRYTRFPVKKHYKPTKLINPTIKSKIADKIENLFPLIGVNGINVFEALLFVTIFKIKFLKFSKQEPIQKINYNRSNPELQWNLDWDSLVENIVPRVFLSITQKPKKPYKLRRVFLGTAAIHYQNFWKRSKLALSVDRGSRLIGIQHGGAYGTFAVHSLVSAVEYTNSNKFLSWGWRQTSYQKENILPVSSPYLSKLKYKCKTNNIIFVNGNLGVFTLRINSFKQYCKQHPNFTY